MLISSVEEYSGKSGFIMALGEILKEKGYRVGYFKPIGIGRFVEGKLIDEDARTVAETLKIEDPIERICPVVMDKPYIEFVLSTNSVTIANEITGAYEEIRKDKDVVLVEGALYYEFGRALGLCDVSFASMLKLNDLMIVKFTDDSVVDRVLSAKSQFGEKLKAVVFNRVTGYKRSYLESLTKSIFEKNGLEVLGMIPKDPLLAGVFVSEIASALGGRFLVEPKEDTIIEQILVGAMAPQSALDYFRRAKNCAVITGGDRTDLITLALEVPSVKCLILTGNLEPPSIVVGMAEDKGVPMIVVAEDTLTTVERAQSVFKRAMIRGKEKIGRMKELIRTFVDLDRLIDIYGL